eukprot:1194134-Prorocentrum_minimum.AAC.3
MAAEPKARAAVGRDHLTAHPRIPIRILLYSLHILLFSAGTCLSGPGGPRRHLQGEPPLAALLARADERVEGDGVGGDALG